jgi:hypothetical protein
LAAAQLEYRGSFAGAFLVFLGFGVGVRFVVALWEGRRRGLRDWLTGVGVTVFVAVTVIVGVTRAETAAGWASSEPAMPTPAAQPTTRQTIAMAMMPSAGMVCCGR